MTEQHIIASREAASRTIAFARRKTKSFTDKYGQFLAIALRFVNMRDQLSQHKNDKIFIAAYRKVRRRYMDLRQEINKEAIYHEIQNR